MPSYPQLAHAPIAEAIISVTLADESHAGTDSLISVADALSVDFPFREDLLKGSVFLQFGPQGGTVGSSSEMKGYRLRDEAQQRYIQILHNNITFNRLPPYDSGDQLVRDFERIWSAFAADLKPRFLAAIELRYINNFRIPIVDWATNFAILPNIQSESAVDDSAVQFGEISTRHQLRSERHVAAATVTTVLTKDEDGESLNCIFDIQTKDDQTVIEYFDFATIEDVLARLRDFKNKLFFANLPKAEELFSATK